LRKDIRADVGQGKKNLEKNKLQSGLFNANKNGSGRESPASSLPFSTSV